MLVSLMYKMEIHLVSIWYYFNGNTKLVNYMIPNPSLFCVSVFNSVICAVNLVLRSKYPAGGKGDKRIHFLSVCFNKAMKENK